MIKEFESQVVCIHSRETGSGEGQRRSGKQHFKLDVFYQNQRTKPQVAGTED